tara:strand:+ start:269 stop:445 length:177 start_codon:yes stop_codon:yes gene_type:complete
MKIKLLTKYLGLLLFFEHFVIRRIERFADYLVVLLSIESLYFLESNYTVTRLKLTYAI